jgi:hypothetical protein
MQFQNWLYASLLIFLFSNPALSQIIPVSLDSRIIESETIAKVKLIDKTAYWNEARTNIYTLNKFQVKAYLKGHQSVEEISIITMGGVVDDFGQKTWPETEFTPFNDYLVFLKKEDFENDHKPFRSTASSIKQYRDVAPIQGAIVYQEGLYKDVLVEKPQSETSLFKKIQTVVQKVIQKPSGELYTPEIYSESTAGKVAVSITSVTDGAGGSASFIAGTIVTDNEMVVTGTGFEADRLTGGFVGFSNADDGGSNYTLPPNDSDYISWSDTEIRVKIPDAAGTGTILVQNNSGDQDTEPVTIDWTMNHVNSDFFNWGSNHRNRIELIDDDGNGGYTFEYSTAGGMSSNSDAKLAFERALSTWRCDSEVNFDVSATSTNVGLAQDDVNVVMFGGLSGSTLGRATSRYSGGATVACDQEDTFWRVSELDLQFSTDYTWWYGSGTCPGGSFTFESTALHELGHCHGLGHVVDVNKVMHYASDPCGTLLSPSSEESTAAAHKIAHSTTANCLPSPPEMTAVGAGSCSLLPVELISFDAKTVGETVELIWATATEINNEGFDIQRRDKNGKWFKLDFVEGNGTTFNFQTYKFIDFAPENGINYYRLKQIDYDGNFEITDVVYAEIELGKLQLKIFPNPVSGGDLNVIFNSDGDISGNLVLFNYLGQPVLTESLSDYRTILSVGDLPAGVYFLKVKKGRKSFTKKVILK